jgi:hypothetical protein
MRRAVAAFMLGAEGRAEQARAGDGVQRPLRSRFQARLTRGVDMTSGVKSCDSSVLHLLTPCFGVIGRAGARKTRRLITRLSVDGLPPDWCPSGTGLGLGTRVACRRFTPTRVVPYRGCASRDTRWHPVVPCRERTSGIRCRHRESHFPGHRPQKGHQCSRHRHPDVIGVLAARHEVSRPLA